MFSILRTWSSDSGERQRLTETDTCMRLADLCMEDVCAWRIRSNSNLRRRRARSRRSWRRCRLTRRWRRCRSKAVGRCATCASRHLRRRARTHPARSSRGCDRGGGGGDARSPVGGGRARARLQGAVQRVLQHRWRRARTRAARSSRGRDRGDSGGAAGSPAGGGGAGGRLQGVGQLCSGTDAAGHARSQRAAEAGAIEAVVAAMQAHPQEEEVQEFYNKTPSHDSGHGTGAHWH